MYNEQCIMKMRFLILIVILILISKSTFSQSRDLKREFRGAWVATVVNIDWPTKNTLSTGEQYIELTRLFDSLNAVGINAIFFQVRAECDAFYKSKYEPWSHWLTGKQGKAPDPYYDPLELAIEEAHRRGMELHAWFNPYRSVRKKGLYEISENHVSVKHPEWHLDFPEYIMLDPGHPEARKYILNVMTDVLENYDVDGIHFDDYFYPYGPKVSNEDSLTFAKYPRGFTNLDDWRRDNINQLMREIYDVVNEKKPHVKFGISPFGIVLNEYAGTNGFNSYDIIYCDPLTWLNEKIVDYVTPQIYWEMDHKLAPYRKLLPWWSTITNDRHLYIGQYSSKMFAEDYKGNYTEIGDQIKMNRNTKNVLGSVFFSAKSISLNWAGFADTLQNNYYKYDAIPPQMEWKDSVKPNKPTNLEVYVNEKDVIVNWDTPTPAEDGDYPYYYLVYRIENGQQLNVKNPANIVYKTFDGETIFIDERDGLKEGSYTYLVTSLDRLHNESDYVMKKVEIRQ
jgi:uncharacterized lipoprotein YddW (UPF0748 family)